MSIPIDNVKYIYYVCVFGNNQQQITTFAVGNISWMSAVS